MRQLTGVVLMLCLFFSATSLLAGDTERTRDKIADKYKWDLSHMFKSDDDWAAKKEALAGKLDKFATYKGKLDQSADILYECLEYTSDIYKEYFLLSGYASKLSDQDTKQAGPMAMSQEIRQIGTKLSAAASFIDPEILAIDTKVIKKFLNEKPELQSYKQYIDDIQRLKPHTRNAAEEELISQAGLMSGTPYDVYGIFKNADMPRPEISVAADKEVKLDDATFTLYRASSDRDLRKKVFEEFFGSYKTYERTFGTQLYSQVKRDMFYKNVRNYDSCLESALNANNIPVAVYKNLIQSVHANLGTLHRYLDLRKKMLGLDDLHYYDMYPSLVKKVEMSYTVEEAQDVIKEALQPLGSDYIATLDEAFTNRWIDMYPNPGKRSGAYSSGAAYDVHPYILMNFMGKYDDVSTLAHEL